MSYDFERPAAAASMSRAELSAIETQFDKHYQLLARRLDRFFVGLMVAQWIGAVVVALWISPYAWEGRSASLHTHVYAALGLGAAITALPVLLASTSPGAPVTRYVIGVAQVLWSALLIHLSGGRIETHFHVFCSLAILAFYRDFRVLVPATLVVAVDHFARGLYWPESVYGVASPEWWRFLEHAGWVVFLDAFLIYNCVQSHRELWDMSRQQVELESAKEAGMRMERLAAIGQLAASVGHELRNPLAAIGNAQTFIRKRLGADVDPRVAQFIDVTQRELEASNKIIGNLLEFSRPKDPVRSACPLKPLVDEVLELTPTRDDVIVVNAIPADFPVPDLDKMQFRQVLLNLIQNAIEAVPKDQAARVVVRADTSADKLTLIVEDNGPGISEELLERIFQPLFSTKVKGTGLGLAVVKNIVERHRGEIRVRSSPGRGTTFFVELPRRAREAA